MPGVSEVFHARFRDHAYPVHTHDTWTLLIVDDGSVRYGLDSHQHGIGLPTVALLPPHVPHDGRPATSHGFRKRVVYLDTSVIGADLVGAAADHPDIADPLLRLRVHQVHQALASPGEELEAESRLTLIGERLRGHLTRRVGEAPSGPSAPSGVADRLRELLDAHVVEGVTLRAAAAELGTHPTHLVRAFTRRFGLPPHRYLTGRRVDLARRLLLAGHPPADVATAVGCYDQAHLTRHFKRYLATTPGRYAVSPSAGPSRGT